MSPGESPESINVHHLHGIGTCRLVKLRDDPRLSGQVPCHHKGPYIHKREAGEAEAEKMGDQKQRPEGCDCWEGAMSQKMQAGSRSRMRPRRRVSSEPLGAISSADAVL